MKYLVNRKTKQHKVLIDDMVWRHDDWQLVGADSEGWIPHTGTECPLPDDCMVEVRRGPSANELPASRSSRWNWSEKNGPLHITHYRPILEPEKAQEPEPIPAPYYDPADLDYEKERAEKDAERKHMEIKEAELKRMMLLDRLKAAHEAAQTIPFLEAELRRELAGMGYTLLR